MKKLLMYLLLPSLLLGSGCKNPLNTHTSKRYYDAGIKAERQGGYEVAQQNYSRALANSRLGGVDKEMEALSLYELSRVTGYLGDHKEAERGFLEVIELSKSPEAKRLNTPALCELARLYFDTNQFQQSLPVFLEASRNLESLGVEQDDPLGYTLFLKDYKVALEKTGDLDEAARVSEKISSIEQKSTKTKPLFIPTRYTK